MIEGQLPIDAFATFFSGYIDVIERIYKWPVGVKAKQTLPEFSWGAWGSVLQETIQLKHFLTDVWAVANDTEKARLARWIVSDWGGVRANASQTIESYLERFSGDCSNYPLQGVASYSKILSVTDCTRFAIYDARVAACLNAIQLQQKAESPIFFHYVPSRNNSIKAFMRKFPKQALVHEGQWREIGKDATYSTYLALLESMKQRLPGTEIYRFEMILFGHAPVICEALTNPRL